MSKVVYVPLDERPCNYQYPRALAKMTDLEMVVPHYNILGDMKVPANVPKLLNWMEAESKDAEHIIVSIDMLIYGGIVPSRLHELTIEACLDRLNMLRIIKAQNPDIRIHAYNLIMRTPAYSSSEEEPNYYEQYGEKVFRLGLLRDRKAQNILSNGEQEEISRLEKAIPKNIKDDYLGRREKNFTVTTQVLDMVENGVIDYLIIPLDDNSEYGFTPKEQRKLMYKIDHKNLLDKVNIYPGADEIACTLFARVFCEVKSYTPELYLRYSSTNGPFIIPRYEDRSLSESIKSHITSAGGVIVNDENNNDCVLMIHSPPVGHQSMAESTFPLETRHHSYFSEVNIREFIQAIGHYVGKKRNVAVADVAICNGGDHSLMQALNKGDLLSEIIAYAGWNTNGNTMGTVVAHAIIAAYYKQGDVKQEIGHEEKSRIFFYSRLVEDWGYQSIVRKHVSYEVLPALSATPRELGDQLVKVTELVDQLLNDFVHKYLSDIPEGRIRLSNVHMPWRRMFEVGFTLGLKG